MFNLNRQLTYNCTEKFFLETYSSVKSCMCCDGKKNDILLCISGSTIPDLLPDHCYVKLKFLDETVQVVQAKPSDTVGEFRR